MEETRLTYITDKIKHLKLRYWIYILIVIFIIFFGAWIFEDNSGEEIVKLNFTVKYENRKFEIVNNDKEDLVNAELTINQYYKIKNINLVSGEAYDIWQVEFIHYNGTHFPSKSVPVEFSIWGELKDGKNGYYYMKLE